MILPSLPPLGPIDPDTLVFLPLGGAGEIGMNLNLYHYAGRWLMVDLGVTFDSELMPGVEVYTPDPAFICDNREALDGLVLTHAHEDHVGAVGHLWRRLQCPVYATPFTAAILRNKLREAGLDGQVPVNVLPVGAQFQVGPFDLEYITLTHSILEPNALAIRTPHGTILHTGDWKFDPDPLIGPTSDLDRLRRLGDDGILALVGDSTNVLVPGHSGSEATVRAALTRVIGRCSRRVAVACFASNVARLESIAVAAAEHGRHVALVGRSLWRMDDAARANGYLADLPPFISDHDAGYLPEDRVCLICTGSQGEPRAALARIATDSHPHVALAPGDTVIFSSRVIPGNERPILDLQNRLARLGVDVITTREEPDIHVSGHPAQEELEDMYRLARPRIAVPVHGEYRHLEAHAQLARNMQVPHAVVAENGTAVRLAPGHPGAVGTVPAGRLAVDGQRLARLDSELLRSRKRMVHNGSAVVTVVVDRAGRLVGDPQLTALGLLDPEHAAEEYAEVVDAVRGAVAGAGPADDETVREAIRRAVRRCLHASHGRKPITDVHLVRV